MNETFQTPPRPQPKPQRGEARSFQARVDYVAKALSRGSWGPGFDACFTHHDGNHVIAAIMQRASRNPKLQEAIMRAFRVKDWTRVPWHSQAAAFEGCSARRIGELAATARVTGQETFKTLWEDPEAVLAASSDH